MHYNAAMLEFLVFLLVVGAIVCPVAFVWLVARYLAFLTHGED